MRIWKRLSMLVTTLLMSCLVLLPSAAQAAGLVIVTTTADEFGENDAACSLREAIQTANEDTDFGGCTRLGSGDYVIWLRAGVYTLTLPGQGEDANASGDLDLNASIRIVGVGAERTIIQAGDTAAAAIDRVLHITTDGEVSLRNLTVRHGMTEMDGNGGAIANTGGGTLTLTDSMVADSIARGDEPGQGGGGIFNAAESTLILHNTDVIGNMAMTGTGNGGGIFNAGGVTIMGGLIGGNSTARAGGGIETLGGSVMLHDVTLAGNYAGINGGGLHISAAGMVSMMGGSATDNVANAEGGGLWNSTAGTMMVDGVTIQGNAANGNDADQGGGGLFDDGGMMTVNNTVLMDNVAGGTSGSGGGIFVNAGAVLTVTNSTLDANTASRAGGGIEVRATVTDTTAAMLESIVLTGNHTGANPGNGGGLHITGPATVEVIESVVMHNSAAAEGGGLWNSSSGTLMVDKSTISHNMAEGSAEDHGGGGLFNDGGKMTVSNSTVSDNTATNAGGGVLNFGETTLIHVTLFENGATNVAGGAANHAGTLNLINSIVAHNDAMGADCANVSAMGSNLDSDGSCGASVTADPMLSPLMESDSMGIVHALQPGSQAMDAADDTTCMEFPVDQLGMSRPMGEGCDLGAVEAVVGDS